MRHSRAAQIFVRHAVGNSTMNENFPGLAAVDYLHSSNCQQSRHELLSRQEPTRLKTCQGGRQNPKRAEGQQLPH
jgi:hypothetical protein